MFYVMEKSYPNDEIIFECESKYEAEWTVKFIKENEPKRGVYYREQTREEFSRIANQKSNVI